MLFGLLQIVPSTFTTDPRFNFSANPATSGSSNDDGTEYATMSQASTWISVRYPFSRRLISERATMSISKTVHS